ncbi:hypothetical protein [Christiangramia forsetii]|uniref:Uncharacterized protein n=2 Tax=Christiangramia forsetii TaxID=411153 RepID=A0M0A5_CHRFK|nr:hypothetical protein [Christiangramia forsetii]GGG41427.1 hypothetical protein GCM10011532_26430 [Christiangramia forsetii]CAL66050.1 hypothetical protein GFO_1076 [Christiangramia forsetii KT0803]
MKIKFQGLVLISILTISCNNGNKQKVDTAKTAETIETEKISKSTRCYGYSKNNDTIYLKVTNLADSLVEGNLTYNLFEKDRNQGSFKGRWKGDSLFADYEFSSEGSISTREIFFFKTDSGFIEGYGPVKDTLNKVKFQEHSTLVLNENILLKPLDCY